MNVNATLPLQNGNSMKNRLMLAPMTNLQSHEDGRLSDEEFTWLTMRAKGGFGLTMTCAAHVHERGKTWSGQLGVFDDKHIEGLTRLAHGIKEFGSLAIVQLFHGGRRAPSNLIGGLPPVAPSADKETDAVELTLSEINQLQDDFIQAAVRCKNAGFDGVEVHAAHGFLICQFLSPEFNHRNDKYGGSAQARERFLDEIIDGIRSECGPEFTLGIRLSPEHHGLVFSQMYELARRLLSEAKIDFLDMSMHDAFKKPDDAGYSSKSLTEWYLELPRDQVPMGICGKIRTMPDVTKIMGWGADFVTIGRSAILQHDFAQKALLDENFQARTTPVTTELLRQEGLSQTFIDFIKTFPDFVTPDI